MNSSALITEAQLQNLRAARRLGLSRKRISWRKHARSHAKAAKAGNTADLVLIIGSVSLALVWVGAARLRRNAALANRPDPRRATVLSIEMRCRSRRGKESFTSNTYGSDGDAGRSHRSRGANSYDPQHQVGEQGASAHLLDGAPPRGDGFRRARRMPRFSIIFPGVWPSAASTSRAAS